MTSLPRPVLAAGLAGVGGVAWFGAAVGYADWTEAVYCAIIAAGFLGTAWALRSGRDRLVAGGLGLSGVGLGLLVLPALGSVEVGTLPWLLYAAGALMAAAAWHLGRPVGVGAGLGAAAIGALVLVVMEDTAGTTLWTPGNVLLFLGLAWMAWELPRVGTAGPEAIAASS